MLNSQSPYAKQFSSTFNGNFGLKGLSAQKNIIMNEKIGHFISKEKRSQMSKDIKGAHFKLGFDQEKIQSVMRDEFKEQNASPDKFNQVSPQQNQNKKSSFMLSSSKTFYNQTVNNQFFSMRQGRESTQSIEQAHQNTVAISENLKKDLRREHFALGSDKIALKTTNMDLASKNMDQSNRLYDNEKKKNAFIKNEMRGHHFTYGKEVPVYSSMSNSHFKEIELSKVKEQEQQSQHNYSIKEIGREYKKQMKNTNAIFQGDPTVQNDRVRLIFIIFLQFRSSSALFFKKDNLNGLETNNNTIHVAPDHLKRSSIELGNSKEQNYISMNQIQQNQIIDQFKDTQGFSQTRQVPYRVNSFSTGIKPQQLKTPQNNNMRFSMSPDLKKYKSSKEGQINEEDVVKMKSFLASSHLKIGDTQATIKDILTTNKDHFSKSSIENSEKIDSDKFSQNLKKENFQITQNNHLTQKNIANFYQSVYKVQSNGDRVKQGKPAQQSGFNAQHASVTLGFHEQNKQSENQARFQPQSLTAEDKAKAKSELEKFSSKIQKHNFEFNYNQNGSIERQFESVQGITNKSLFKSFNKDSFASQKGDATQLKSYLQQSHLKFGSYNTQKDIDDRRAALSLLENQKKSHSKMQSGLRTSSEVVFGTSKNDFKTQNKDFYSWIQPKLMQ